MHCTNSRVRRVFTIGLMQAFSGNRRKATMASKDGGVCMIMDSTDNTVTVIDAMKLLRITAPNRTATRIDVLFDFCIFPD